MPPRDHFRPPVEAKNSWDELHGMWPTLIGNPPYGALSELESGQDLSALKAVIEAEPTFAPSRRGKNNLYKLFICRALDLLLTRRNGEKDR